MILVNIFMSTKSSREFRRNDINESMFIYFCSIF